MAEGPLPGGAGGEITGAPDIGNQKAYDNEHGKVSKPNSDFSTDGKDPVNSGSATTGGPGGVNAR